MTSVGRSSEFQIESGLSVFQPKPRNGANLSINMRTTSLKPMETSDDEWDNPTPPKALVKKTFKPETEMMTQTAKEKGFQISNSPKIMSPSYGRSVGGIEGGLTQSRFNPNQTKTNSLLEAFRGGKDSSPLEPTTLNPLKQNKPQTHSVQESVLTMQKPKNAKLSKLGLTTDTSMSAVEVNPSSTKTQLSSFKRQVSETETTQISARQTFQDKVGAQQKFAFVRKRNNAVVVKEKEFVVKNNHAHKMSTSLRAGGEKEENMNNFGAEPTEDAPYGKQLSLATPVNHISESAPLKPTGISMARKLDGVLAKANKTTGIRVTVKKQSQTLNTSTAETAAGSQSATKIVPRAARHTSMGPLKAPKDILNQKRNMLVQGTQKEADDEAQLKKVMTSIRAQQLDQTFETIMRKYLQLQSGTDGPTKSGVMIFVSGDSHISRFFTSQNWIVTYRPMVMNFELFHLKWVVQDKSTDYEGILPDQYINHFQNNKELTSKSFLKKNLETFVDAELPHYEYFPKSYDLSSPEEAKSLAKDYLMNCVFVLLKKHLIYFCRRFGGLKALREHLMKQTEQIHFLIQRDREGKERIYSPMLKPSFNAFFVDTMVIDSEFQLR